MRADPTRRRRVLPVIEAVRSHGRPDILHVHWTEPYIARGAATSRAESDAHARRAALAERRAGRRIVWTAHDLFRHDQASPTRASARSCAASVGSSDAIIVHCGAGP